MNVLAQLLTDILVTFLAVGLTIVVIMFIIFTLTLAYRVLFDK